MVVGPCVVSQTEQVGHPVIAYTIVGDALLGQFCDVGIDESGCLIPKVISRLRKAHIQKNNPAARPGFIYQVSSSILSSLRLFRSMNSFPHLTTGLEYCPGFCIIMVPVLPSESLQVFWI